MEQPPHARPEGPPATSTRRPDDSVAGRAWVRGGAGVLLVVGAMGVGGLVAHVALEKPALEAAQARVRHVEHELESLRARLSDSHRNVAALEGQLMVEESTRRGLETALRTTQEELGRARDAVAFYEQLMPPGPQGAIAIRALDVERVGPHLAYRLLLMRSGASDKPFQGSLQFLAEGLRDGELVSLAIHPTVQGPDDVKGAPPDGQAAANDALLAVELENFQRASGVLALPADFQPQTLIVNVLEGRSIRATRRVELTSGD